MATSSIPVIPSTVSSLASTPFVGSRWAGTLSDTAETVAVDLFPQPVSPNLRAAIDKAIAAVPLDQRGAVSFDVTLKGTQVAVAQKWGSHWSAGAYAAYEWHGDKTAGLTVSGSW